ncbi:MAG: acyl-CoA dehydrogenase C-terminal domain-containing protein, partial [Bauldia litoralis]
VETGLALLHDASNQLMASMSDAPRDALAGATPYLQLAGRVYIGWMWLRAAGDGPSGDGGDDPIGQEYRVLARFYAEQIMTDCHALLARALTGAEAIDALSAEQIARV